MNRKLIPLRVLAGIAALAAMPGADAQQNARSAGAKQLQNRCA